MDIEDDETDPDAGLHDGLFCLALRLIMTVDGAPGRCRRRECRVQRSCQLEPAAADGALPVCQGGRLGRAHAWEALMMATFHENMRDQGM